MDGHLGDIHVLYDQVLAAVMNMDVQLSLHLCFELKMGMEQHTIGQIKVMERLMTEHNCQ
jgi:hypothetical protein